MGELENSTIFKHISISRFASRTLDHELERNTQTVIPYIGLTFILMILFSTLTSSMTDWVRSKPYLGLLGIVSATMATLSAFGFCMYLGVDFIGLNLAAPFLLIGNFQNYVTSFHESLISPYNNTCMVNIFKLSLCN